MEGAVEVDTANAKHFLTAGASLAIGANRWHGLRPRPRARIWTVYLDEVFLREQMRWLLPDRRRVRPGIHPDDWGAGSRLLHPGVTALELLEPLWRQMNVLNDGTRTPEFAAARTIELFAHWAGIVVPAILAPEIEPVDATRTSSVTGPVRGRLTDSAALGPTCRAVRLLRERMNEPWTVRVLAEEVALSRAHLTRLFVQRTGVAPIRFLTEVRLTEFTRLIEETELSITRAAHLVGWTDPRIASGWFYRRFGITPSHYRLNPHPHHVES